VQHADTLALLARQTSIETVQGLESTLLALGRASHPGQLKVACDKARHCADPDGALKDTNRAHESRYLRVCSGFNGMVHLDAQLDPTAGAAVQATLDAVMGLPAPGDTRTRYQRQADALVEVSMDRGPW
jgi:hypothetical protein